MQFIKHIQLMFSIRFVIHIKSYEDTSELFRVFLFTFLIFKDFLQQFWLVDITLKRMFWDYLCMLLWFYHCIHPKTKHHLY